MERTTLDQAGAKNVLQAARQGAERRMHPRQSQWWIAPVIANGLCPGGKRRRRNRRRERLRGCNGRQRSSRTISIWAEPHLTTALQHCAPGCQQALTPSRWRCRRCGFEQGDRHWIANAAAASLKSSTGDGSVQVTRPMPDTQTQVPVRARRPDSPRRSPF
jgi:hypothetical protein